MLDALPNSFTTAQAERCGVARWRLHELRDAGEVVALSRGVWRRAEAPEIAHESLLAVSLRAPRGTICLLSALVFHELIDEFATEVHLAVPRGLARRDGCWKVGGPRPVTCSRRASSCDVKARSVTCWRCCWHETRCVRRSHGRRGALPESAQGACEREVPLDQTVVQGSRTGVEDVDIAAIEVRDVASRDAGVSRPGDRRDLRVGCADVFADGSTRRGDGRRPIGTKLSAVSAFGAMPSVST